MVSGKPPPAHLHILGRQNAPRVLAGRPFPVAAAGATSNTRAAGAAGWRGPTARGLLGRQAVKVASAAACIQAWH